MFQHVKVKPEGGRAAAVDCLNSWNREFQFFKRKQEELYRDKLEKMLEGVHRELDPEIEQLRKENARLKLDKYRLQDMTKKQLRGLGIELSVLQEAERRPTEKKKASALSPPGPRR